MYQLELKKWLVAYRFPVFEGWDVPARCNWARRGRLFLQGRGFQDLYFTSRLWTESPLRSPSPEQHWSRKIGDKITNVLFPCPILRREGETDIWVFPAVQPNYKKPPPNLRHPKIVCVQLCFKNPKASSGKKPLDNPELLIMPPLSQTKNIFEDKKIQIEGGV
jgi:hypothetical protein